MSPTPRHEGSNAVLMLVALFWIHIIRRMTQNQDQLMGITR